MHSPERYESVMRDAREIVFLVAARRGFDISLIDVDIDAGLGPGHHKVHILVISVRGAPVSVRERNIPHEWLRDGTGFIDDRFAKLVASLLIDLTAKAKTVGVMLVKNV